MLTRCRRCAEAEALLKVHGRNELEERNKPKWLLFLEQFYAPMPCMIWVACGVELLIEDWTDFWILLSLQFINASVSFYEAARAGDAVGPPIDAKWREPRSCNEPPKPR